MALPFTNPFSGMGSGIFAGLKIFLFYIFPIISVLIIALVIYRNKKIFMYKVRLYKIRENGKVKEVNFKAGYIGRKNSAPYFRIKTGPWWWQHIDLITTPVPRSMDLDNRLYYLQTDVRTYVQLKREVNINNKKISFTPLEGQDVKYGAILSGKRIRDVLRMEPTWKKVLPYIVLVTLAIIFIIAYVLVLNSGSA